MEHMMMPMDKPRGMNYLTVAERVAVIQEYDLVPNIPYLARKYHCGRRQIRNILKRRDDYLEEWKNNPNPQCLPRRQPSRIKAVNMLLYTWCQRALIHGYELSDDLFKEVGRKIAEAIKVVEFLPEKRWMNRFKKRFNIDQLTVDAETYDMCEKPSLEIADLCRDLEPEVTMLLARKPVVEKPNTRPIQLSYKMVSPSHFESSNEPVECIDILSDSESEESSQNLLVARGQQHHDDTMPYSDENNESMEHFYPAVEMSETGETAKSLTSYKEALNHLGPLEQFALLKENVRAIGLINQIENILREEMEKEN